MPNSGKTPARAPRGAKPGERRGQKPGAKNALAKKSKHSVAGRDAKRSRDEGYKVREDGRGGRSPQRQVEDGGRKPRHSASRAGHASAAPREMHKGRADRGRDWTPPENREGGRGGRDRFADRGARSDRAPRGDRFADRGARFRDERPARDDRAPRSDRFSRDERPARSDRFEDRGARGARSDRPRFDRDDRAPRSRDRFEGRRDGGRPDRADRVERDRTRDRSFEDARSGNASKKAFVEDVVLERLQGLSDDEAIIEETFEAMNLHPKILTALAGMGAVSPFPIQAATIPAAIQGRDVLGRGKTGSGKTVAFSVPIVTKLLAAGSVQRKPGQARALVLAPTRELADQIERTLKGLARGVGFFTVCIYGGVPQRRQEIAMSRGTDIIVATPGRLEDLMAQKIVDLSAVETIVVDEADHMCDLGFIEPVRRIMRAVGDSQKLLFSATLDAEVGSLVKEFLPDPYIYEVADEVEDHSNITHRVLTVDDHERSAVLLRLVQGEGKSLIFTRTKMTAERLSESLTSAGVPAARLHGDLNQNQRNRNLERFHSGATRVMVATDVAARGIHVDDVGLVIQLDPPLEYKTYLHRAGRTGRAGKEGVVITLIPRSRRRKMEDLLRRADRDGIFTEVRPANPLLEQLAGPIAPPPAPEGLDFGDSRGGNGGGRGGRDRDRDRGPRGDRKPYGDRGGRGDRKPYGDRDGKPRGKFEGKRDGFKSKRKFD